MTDQKPETIKLVFELTPDRLETLATALNAGAVGIMNMRDEVCHDDPENRDVYRRFYGAQIHELGQAWLAAYIALGRDSDNG